MQPTDFSGVKVHLIGDKEKFAIEYVRVDIAVRCKQPEEYVPHGSFRCWLAGQPFGDYEVIENLGQIATELQKTYDLALFRELSSSSHMGKKDLFMFLHWASSEFYDWPYFKPLVKTFMVEALQKVNHGLTVPFEEDQDNIWAFMLFVFSMSRVSYKILEHASIYIVNETFGEFKKQRILWKYRESRSWHKKIFELILPYGYVDECIVKFVQALEAMKNESLEERSLQYIRQKFLYPELYPENLPIELEEMRQHGFLYREKKEEYVFWYDSGIGAFYRLWVDDFGHLHNTGRSDRAEWIKVPQEVKDYFHVAM